MEEHKLEFRERDQCSKDFSKMYQKINQRYFTSCMHNFKKIMASILMLFKYMTEW